MTFNGGRFELMNCVGEDSNWAVCGGFGGREGGGHCAISVSTARH